MDSVAEAAEAVVTLTESWLSLRTSDVDEARAFLDPRFYSSTMAPTGGGRALSARMTVTPLRRVTLSDVSFGADLRIAFGKLDAYQVNVPLSGHLHSRQGSGGVRLAAPGTAVIYEPDAGAVEDRWSADCRVIGVKIEADVLHRQLSAMAGEPVGPLRCGPLLDGPAELLASWCRLVRWLHADSRRPYGLANHPLMGDRLQEAVVAGLLSVLSHRHGERFPAAGPPVANRAVRRVVEAVQAHPDQPYTLAALSGIAGLGHRALQQGFRHHLGTTPMGFVRDIRLARAHDELRRAERSSVTVAAVAHRWGFVHLGRFAQLYRARYGVSPSETLRR